MSGLQVIQDHLTQWNNAVNGNIFLNSRSKLLIHSRLYAPFKTFIKTLKWYLNRKSLSSEKEIRNLTSVIGKEEIQRKTWNDNINNSSFTENQLEFNKYWFEIYEKIYDVVIHDLAHQASIVIYFKDGNATKEGMNTVGFKTLMNKKRAELLEKIKVVEKAKNDGGSVTGRSIEFKYKNGFGYHAFRNTSMSMKTTEIKYKSDSGPENDLSHIIGRKMRGSMDFDLMIFTIANLCGLNSQCEEELKTDNGLICNIKQCKNFRDLKEWTTNLFWDAPSSSAWFPEKVKKAYCGTTKNSIKDNGPILNIKPNKEFYKNLLNEDGTFKETESENDGDTLAEKTIKKDERISVENWKPKTIIQYFCCMLVRVSGTGKNKDDPNTLDYDVHEGGFHEEVKNELLELFRYISEVGCNSEIMKNIVKEQLLMSKVEIKQKLIVTGVLSLLEDQLKKIEGKIQGMKPGTEDYWVLKSTKMNELQKEFHDLYSIDIVILESILKINLFDNVFKKTYLKKFEDLKEKKEIIMQDYTVWSFFDERNKMADIHSNLFPFEWASVDALTEGGFIQTGGAAFYGKDGKGKAIIINPQVKTVMGEIFKDFIECDEEVNDKPIDNTTNIINNLKDEMEEAKGEERVKLNLEIEKWKELEEKYKKWSKKMNEILLPYWNESEERFKGEKTGEEFLGHTIHFSYWNSIEELDRDFRADSEGQKLDDNVNFPKEFLKSDVEIGKILFNLKDTVDWITVKNKTNNLFNMLKMIIFYQLKLDYHLLGKESENIELVGRILANEEGDVPWKNITKEKYLISTKNMNLKSGLFPEMLRANLAIDRLEQLKFKSYDLLISDIILTSYDAANKFIEEDFGKEAFKKLENEEEEEDDGENKSRSVASNYKNYQNHATRKHVKDNVLPSLSKDQAHDFLDAGTLTNRIETDLFGLGLSLKIVSDHNGVFQIDGDLLESPNPNTADTFLIIDDDGGNGITRPMMDGDKKTMLKTYYNKYHAKTSSIKGHGKQIAHAGELHLYDETDNRFFGNMREMSSEELRETMVDYYNPPDLHIFSLLPTKDSCARVGKSLPEIGTKSYKKLFTCLEPFWDSSDINGQMHQWFWYRKIKDSNDLFGSTNYKTQGRICFDLYLSTDDEAMKNGIIKAHEKMILRYFGSKKLRVTDKSRFMQIDAGKNYKLAYSPVITSKRDMMLGNLPRDKGIFTLLTTAGKSDESNAKLGEFFDEDYKFSEPYLNPGTGHSFYKNLSFIEAATNKNITIIPIDYYPVLNSSDDDGRVKLLRIRMKKIKKIIENIGTKGKIKYIFDFMRKGTWTVGDRSRGDQYNHKREGIWSFIEGTKLADKDNDEKNLNNENVLETIEEEKKRAILELINWKVTSKGENVYKDEQMEEMWRDIEDNGELKDIYDYIFLKGNKLCYQVGENMKKINLISTANLAGKQKKTLEIQQKPTMKQYEHIVNELEIMYLYYLKLLKGENGLYTEFFKYKKALEAEHDNEIYRKYFDDLDDDYSSGRVVEGSKTSIHWDRWGALAHEGTKEIIFYNIQYLDGENVIDYEEHVPIDLFKLGGGAEITEGHIYEVKKGYNNLRNKYRQKKIIQTMANWRKNFLYRKYNELSHRRSFTIAREEDRVWDIEIYEHIKNEWKNINDYTKNSEVYGFNDSEVIKSVKKGEELKLPLTSLLVDIIDDATKELLKKIEINKNAPPESDAVERKKYFDGQINNERIHDGTFFNPIMSLFDESKAIRTQEKNRINKYDHTLDHEGKKVMDKYNKKFDGIKKKFNLIDLDNEESNYDIFDYDDNYAKLMTFHDRNIEKENRAGKDEWQQKETESFIPYRKKRYDDIKNIVESLIKEQQTAQNFYDYMDETKNVTQQKDKYLNRSYNWFGNIDKLINNIKFLHPELEIFIDDDNVEYTTNVKKDEVEITPLEILFVQLALMDFHIVPFPLLVVGQEWTDDYISIRRTVLPDNKRDQISSWIYKLFVTEINKKISLENKINYVEQSLSYCYYGYRKTKTEMENMKSDKDLYVYGIERVVGPDETMKPSVTMCMYNYRRRIPIALMLLKQLFKKVSPDVDLFGENVIKIKLENDQQKTYLETLIKLEFEEFCYGTQSIGAKLIELEKSINSIKASIKKNEKKAEKAKDDEDRLRLNLIIDKKKEEDKSLKDQQKEFKILEKNEKEIKKKKDAAIKKLKKILETDNKDSRKLQNTCNTDLEFNLDIYLKECILCKKGDMKNDTAEGDGGDKKEQKKGSKRTEGLTSYPYINLTIHQLIKKIIYICKIIEAKDQEDPLKEYCLSINEIKDTLKSYFDIFGEYEKQTPTKKKKDYAGRYFYEELSSDKFKIENFFKCDEMKDSDMYINMSDILFYLTSPIYQKSFSDFMQWDQGSVLQTTYSPNEYGIQNITMTGTNDGFAAYAGLCCIGAPTLYEIAVPDKVKSDVGKNPTVLFSNSLEKNMYYPSWLYITHHRGKDRGSASISWNFHEDGIFLSNKGWGYLYKESLTENNMVENLTNKWFKEGVRNIGYYNLSCLSHNTLRTIISKITEIDVVDRIKVLLVVDQDDKLAADGLLNGLKHQLKEKHEDNILKYFSYIKFNNEGRGNSKMWRLTRGVDDRVGEDPIINEVDDNLDVGVNVIKVIGIRADFINEYFSEIEKDDGGGLNLNDECSYVAEKLHFWKRENKNLLKFFEICQNGLKRFQTYIEKANFVWGDEKVLKYTMSDGENVLTFKNTTAVEKNNNELTNMRKVLLDKFKNETSWEDAINKIKELEKVKFWFEGDAWNGLGQPVEPHRSVMKRPSSLFLKYIPYCEKMGDYVKFEEFLSRVNKILSTNGPRQVMYGGGKKIEKEWDEEDLYNVDDMVPYNNSYYIYKPKNEDEDEMPPRTRPDVSVDWVKITSEVYEQGVPVKDDGSEGEASASSPSAMDIQFDRTRSDQRVTPGSSRRGVKPRTTNIKDFKKSNYRGDENKIKYYIEEINKFINEIRMTEEELKMLDRIELIYGEFKNVGLLKLWEDQNPKGTFDWYCVDLAQELKVIVESEDTVGLVLLPDKLQKVRSKKEYEIKKNTDEIKSHVRLLNDVLEGKQKKTHTPETMEVDDIKERLVEEGVVSDSSEDMDMKPPPPNSRKKFNLHDAAAEINEDADIENYEADVSVEIEKRKIEIEKRKIEAKEENTILNNELDKLLLSLDMEKTDGEAMDTGGEGRDDALMGKVVPEGDDALMGKVVSDIEMVPEGDIEMVPEGDIEMVSEGDIEMGTAVNVKPDKFPLIGKNMVEVGEKLEEEEEGGEGYDPYGIGYKMEEGEISELTVEQLEDRLGVLNDKETGEEQLTKIEKAERDMIKEKLKEIYKSREPMLIRKTVRYDKQGGGKKKKRRNKTLKKRRNQFLVYLEGLYD